MAENVVAPDVEPAVHVVAHTLGGFAGVDDRADTRQVRDKLTGAVGAVDAELFGNVLLGDEHRRAVDAFAQVDHAPAIQRIDAGCAEVGGGGTQHAGDLCAGHVREAFHQHRHRAGNVRCRHGGAVVIGVAGSQVSGIGAADDRTVDPAARRRHAETRGVAAARREGADVVGVGTVGVRVLLQGRDGHPVRRDLGDEITEAGDGVRVVEVVVVTGGENRHDAAAGRRDGAVVGTAGFGPQQGPDLVELQLCILHGEVRIRRVPTAEVEAVGDADAPAIVDDPRAAGDQGVPTGLVHRAVVAAYDTVFRARVAVVGADDLCTKGDAVHRSAIAAAGGDPANVGAVGTEFAVGAHRGRTVIEKGVPDLDRNVRVGVLADAAGHQRDDLIGSGKLRVQGVYRLVEDPQLHAFAGVTGRIGILRVDRPQAPVSAELCAAPAFGIACPAVFHVGCRVCGAQCGQRAEHG
ncbi:hypothetical protein D3C87_1126370 [compost metagenome]